MLKQLALTISQRFWIWAAFATLIFYVAVFLGWRGLSSARDNLESVYDDRMVPTLDLADISDRLNDNGREVLLAFQHAPNGPLAALHDHPATQHLDSIKTNAEEISLLWKKYMATFQTEEEKRLATNFDAKRSAWLLKLNNATAAIERGDFSPQVMADYLAAWRQEYKATGTALKSVRDYQAKAAKEAYEEADKSYRTTRAIFIFLVCFGAIIGTPMGLMILMRLKNGFAAAQSAAQAIAEGDLTRPVPVQGNDEIGQLLATIAVMRENLQHLISELRDNLKLLAVHARDLRGAATNGTAAAEQQAESSSSMAAAVEQLSVSIDQVEAHAREARSIAQESAESADNGAELINNSGREISNVAVAVNATASAIRDLESTSGQISAIVRTINDIAEQTNLLALNAAIEAARAGEHGRGFAVVADEVRKLAERTRSSTGEIAAMIEKIQHGAHEAASRIEAGVEKVEEGVEITQLAGESIGYIREMTGRITTTVDEIALALKEQSEATREIAGRVEQVSQGTEEIAGSSRLTSASAAELEQLAENLERLAGKFRVA